jgi:histidinol-phosphate aminotransferase
VKSVFVELPPFERYRSGYLDDDAFLALQNLLLMATLSKVGMAGLRLGYAVAAPEWIAELDKLRPPYNVNSLTQAAVLLTLPSLGVTAIKHELCISIQTNSIFSSTGVLRRVRSFGSARTTTVQPFFSSAN